MPLIVVLPPAARSPNKAHKKSKNSLSSGARGGGGKRTPQRAQCSSPRIRRSCKFRPPGEQQWGSRRNRTNQWSFLNGSKCYRDAKDRGHQGTPSSEYQKYGRGCTGRGMAGNEAKDRASISHDAQNHKPIPTTKSPEGAAQQSSGKRHQTQSERKPDRPTPHPPRA